MNQIEIQMVLILILSILAYLCLFVAENKLDRANTFRFWIGAFKVIFLILSFMDWAGIILIKLSGSNGLRHKILVVSAVQLLCFWMALVLFKRSSFKTGKIGFPAFVTGSLGILLSAILFVVFVLLLIAVLVG